MVPVAGVAPLAEADVAGEGKVRGGSERESKGRDLVGVRLAMPSRVGSAGREGELFKPE